MTKIIKSLLLIGSVVLSAQLEAKTLSLAPNETKMLANSAPFTINATCNVHANHPINAKVRIVVLKNQGVINGRNLSSGQGTSVRVKNNSNISVSAEAGTQINLINMGSEHLEAVCML